MLSKKMGRPTNNPKNTQMPVRFSDEDIQKLEYCCNQTGLTKANIIRKGIDAVYQDLKKNIEKGGDKMEIKTSTHVFQFAIDNQNIEDMKHVMNEFLKFGYKKISEFVYEGNTILIFARKL